MTLEELRLDRDAGHRALWWSGITLGVLAGAAVATYLWQGRTRASNPPEEPLDRAESLIASCESKIHDIERAIEELKEAAR
ncbi:MAG TPA: hypothetical protein VF681_07775 [Abditibacteriaceae bacterium]|jgi:hypothetical protein